MMVSPVSSSPRILKVGSSSDNFFKDMLIFSWSALVFGSIRKDMTGSGTSMPSSRTALSGSQRVSPVRVSFKPTVAAMLPAKTSFMSSLWLACNRTMRQKGHCRQDQSSLPHRFFERLSLPEEYPTETADNMPPHPKQVELLCFLTRSRTI